MPTSRKTISIYTTEEFYAMVKKYKAWRGHRSMSAALLELAAIGASKVVKTVPPLRAGWGGDRRSDGWEDDVDAQLERLDHIMLGLPPEPMDDD